MDKGKIIRRLLEPFGYKITKINRAENDIIFKPEFNNIYQKCKDYTMTSRESMYALYNAVRYIIKAKIPGDFVECGPYKGGSVMNIAYTLLEMGVNDRKIWLYDTFEGMTKPTKEDYRIEDNTQAIDKWEEEKKGEGSSWVFCPIEEIQKNLSLTGYPEKNLIFVKGRVEDTIPGKSPKNISLLRLDTDFYESTKHELVNLFPIVEKAGVLIIDDYGHWAGSKKAVDDYFNNKPILLDRIDYSARIGVKIV